MKPQGFNKVKIVFVCYTATCCDRNISIITKYTVLTDRSLLSMHLSLSTVETWRHDKIVEKEPVSLNILNACLHNGERRKDFLLAQPQSLFSVFFHYISLVYVTRRVDQISVCVTNGTLS